mgnify:CR=1 FL=1
MPFLQDKFVAVGASGAIFGLLGSITYFTYYYRATIQGFLNGPIVPALITNLIVGLMFTNIGIMGHIGGFIGGILISMALGVKYKSTNSFLTSFFQYHNHLYLDYHCQQ